MANTTNKKNVYWDSCVWIRLIQKEAGYEDCEYIIEQAQAGRIQIWSSSLVLAEVYKIKAPNATGQFLMLAEVNDTPFEEFMRSEFVTEVQVDHDIAVSGRRLCRKYAPLKKPNDGIHFATALEFSVDELHTIDGTDLLPLNGLENRKDGAPLVICMPPKRPPLPLADAQAPLFTE